MTTPREYIESIKDGAPEGLLGFAVGSLSESGRYDVELATCYGPSCVEEALQEAVALALADGAGRVTEVTAIGEASTDQAIRVLQALLFNDSSAVREALWDDFSDDACEAIADRLIGDEGAIDDDVAQAINDAIEAVQRALTAAWDGCSKAGRVIELGAARPCGCQDSDTCGWRDEP